MIKHLLSRAAGHRGRLAGVVVAYAITGWIVIDVVVTTAPVLRLPPWFATAVVVLVLIGLPFALILSALFGRTHERSLPGDAALPGRQQASSRIAPQFSALRTLIRRVPRKVRVAGGGSFALLAVLAAALLGSGPDPVPENESDNLTTLAVMPFSVRGDQRLAYLSEGMVEVLSGDMGRYLDLQVVDVFTVLSHFSDRGAAPVDPAAARVIAETFGARLFVLGSVLEVEGQMRITASLYDRSRGARPLATKVVEGTASEALQLGRRLGLDMISAVPRAGSPENTPVRLLWSGDGVDLLGSPSPDGRMLSHVDWSTGNLAVRHLAQRRTRQLTSKMSWATSDEFAETSSFSPDGRSLAYTWLNSGWLYELRVLNLDTDQSRTVHVSDSVSGWVGPQAWSRDGSRILSYITRGDGVAVIAWIGAHTGAVDTLRALDRRWIGKIALAPDESWIAYDYPESSGGMARDIHIVSADGRNAGRISYGANEVVLGADPRGGGLLFWSDHGAKPAVYFQRLHDTRPLGTAMLVRSEMEWLYPLGFAGRDFFYGVTASERQALVVEVDLDGPRLITEPVLAAHASAGSSLQPVWSPDAKRLAYLVQRPNSGPGAFKLAVRSLPTGELQEYPLELERPAQLQWLNDGSGVFMSGRSGGVPAFFSFDLETHDLKRLFAGEQYPVQRVLLARSDGSAVYDRWVGATTIEFVQRELQGNGEKVLHSGRGTSLLALAPDGSELLYSERADSTAGGAAVYLLKKMPTAGNEQSRAYNVPVGRYPVAAAWTHDGLHILLVLSLINGGDAELWALAVGDGKITHLLTRKGLTDVSVSPDSRSVAFTAGEFRSEVWLMEDPLGAVHEHHP